MHHIGMLMNLAEQDPESIIRKAMFVKGLADLNWEEGRDYWIDHHYGEGDAGMYVACANKLVADKAEVVLVSCGPTWNAILAASGSAMDIVVAGMIGTARTPKGGRGGILTGLSSYNADLAATWLKILKKVAPDVKSVGVVHNNFTGIGPAMCAAIDAAKRKFGVTELIEIEVRDAATNPTQFRKNIANLAAKPHSGLIVTAGAMSVINRQTIIDAVNKNKLRAVYSNRMFVDSGGLISYGAVTRELYQDAADFVQKILTKQKVPGVQLSSKFELVVNFDLAKKLKLGISPEAPFVGF